MFKRQLVLLVLAGTALLPLSCGPADTVTIQSAGATFPAPLYKRWFLEFYKAHPNVRVNYQAIGSGAGVSQLQEGLTNFGASDEALKKEKLDEIAKVLSDREHKPVELIQIPLTAGSIALCYNLPGNPELQLPRKVYVGMILAQIKFWDDDAIKAANPSIALPHLQITFVRRADSSGTTFVFTTHLNAIDDRWKKDNGGPGPGKTVQWPAAIGGKGNSGVAALIQQTPGAFGYIETGYAEQVGLRPAKLENHAGNYVEPTDENCLVALEEAKFNDVLGASIPDAKGKAAYPIVSFTWVICRKHYANKTLGDNIKAVFSYCLQDEPGQGQSLSKDLGYIAMPRETLLKARKAIDQINADQEPSQ